MKLFYSVVLFLFLCFDANAQTQGVVGFHRKSSGLPYNPNLKPFYHGIASGDPMTDRVIIWTRITPDSNETTRTANWIMATDTGLKNIVKSGAVTTDTSKDFTVKIDVTGLSPATTYYYAFTSNGTRSTIGRARTAPLGTVNHLRFAVVSCNNYEAGFFNAFARIASRNDIDAVLHLGDYIYEYGAKQYGDSTTGRFVEPENEAVTEWDYRTRYSLYHLDADLQLAHQQQTFITVWDDHESANDSYKDGAQNHQPGTEGDWQTRKAISKKVYFEWMPIRDVADNHIYRTISYGNLAELIMLDARIEGRDAPPANFDDPDTLPRTMLGNTQYQWFVNQLKASTAKWKIVGNQMLFSDLNVGFSARNGQGLPTPSDINAIRGAENIFINSWESYPTERNAIIDTIENAGIKNVVIITGDSHCSWAFDVTKKPAIYPDSANKNYASPSPSYNPATGQGSVAVEFCTPSISSANMDERIGLPLSNQFEIWVNSPISFLNNSNYNPHLKFADVDRHGYFVLDLKTDSAQANYYFVEKISAPSKIEDFAVNAFTLNNSGRVLISNNPASPKAKQEIPAPAKTVVTAMPTIPQVAIFHAYPNPASDVFNIQYGLTKGGLIKITVYDVQGKIVNQWQQQQEAGLYNYSLDVSRFEKGMYLFTLETEGKISSGKFLVK